jgi:RHS repeat-associated protein
VSLSDQYNYDAFGRFDNHTHKIAGSTEYNLEMSYNKAGGIIQKDALATGITNFQGLNYTLDYSYVAGKPHQLQSVFDQKSGITSDYIYNSSGSIKEIIDPGAGGPQQFYWNEEQWLSGVSNDLGVHHYVYDYKGERIMKSSVMQSAVQVNDQNIDDVQYLDPYTLYINPYYVVTELQGGDKVSKHYYMNTQRVATDISINYQGPTPLAGPLQQNASDPKKPSADTASVNYNAAFADLQQTLEQFGKSKLDVDHLGTQPTLEAYYPELAKSKSSNVNGTESTTRVMFWYHPDYLGNVDLVTERDGKTYEFFTYNPWGEEMHQYNANTFGFASPYRFNSKEKDQETGLHYYGARYYSSKLSVWMSVDPLAHKTLQPYIFTSNNTLLFIDPDGRENIVIIGNQGSRPNSDANSGSDKKHFLEAGLKEAFELNKQNEQNTTILITKGDYTEEQLFSITERANVYGINVLIIEGGAGDVIDYINNGANQNRNQDLITDLVYVGHSTDDNLYIGQGVGLDRALSSDRITREIKSEAFYTESTVKLNSCRAGNCSIVPNSIATAFASKVSKVFATPNYVNWSLPVGTYDTNLPNNQWQTTEGTGGVVGSVLKQKVELKSKSIKL